MPNPTDALTELDDRAGRAARALRAEADRRPVPPFEPDEAMAQPAPTALADHRSRRRVVIGSIAAACLLVAGIAAWVAGSGDDAGPAGGVSTDLPRPFVLGEVPAALELAWVHEVVESPDPGEGLEAPLHLYGPDPSEVVLGAALIDGYDAFDEAPPSGFGPELVQVGGRAVQLYEAVGFGPLMVMAQVDGGAVALLGAPDERDGLLALAAEVEARDGAPVFPDGTLEQGWSEVGIEPVGVFLASPVAMGGGGTSDGRFVAYLAVREDGVAASPMVSVSSLPADPARLHAPALVADRVEAATVRGHEAQVAVAPTPDAVEEGGSMVIVSWLESETELVRLHAVGLSVEEVVALAEGLRAVEPAEWEALVEATLLDDLNPVDREGEEIGRGRFDDGTPWVLRALDPSGESTTQVTLDVAIADDEDGSMGSSASASANGGGSDGGVVVSYELLETGGRRFLSGSLDEVAAAVELRADDGTLGGTAAVDEGPLRWFVLEVPPGSWDLVVLDRGGAEAGRVPVGADGHVDIDGAHVATTTIVAGPGD